MSDHPAFDDEFRRWASRPAGTSTRRASDRVAAALPDRQQTARLPLTFLAAAAALVMAVAGAMWVATPRNAGAPSAARGVDSVRPLPLEENVVLWWIDPDTPVYFVLQPRDSVRGPR
jgi:hypothetical protein